MKTVLLAFLAMPTVLSVLLGMPCYCEGKLEADENVPIDWFNEKNVDGDPAYEVDDNTPSYADLEEKLKKVEEELVDVEEEVELMEGEGAGGPDEEKTLEQTKLDKFFDSEEPPDDRFDEDKPLEPMDSDEFLYTRPPWSDGEAHPTDIDGRSFHASEEEEEEEGGRRRELTKRADENVGTSALRGVNEAEAISGGSVEQLNRRLHHYPQYHFPQKAGWCTPWGSGDELCSGAYGQQSETCKGVDAKFYIPAKTCDHRCIRDRCSADALCAGYTKRKSDGAFKLKSKITGVRKSNGYDCYEKKKIKTGTNACYVMQIDCYHGDDSDGHSRTDDPIRFYWYDETGSLLYATEYSSSECDLFEDMTVHYYERYAGSVAYVNVIATGSAMLL